MDRDEITPLEQVIHCIKIKRNFVLQGGAGSGKTETLQKILSFISTNYPGRRVACITHTNLAANEIISRVGNNYTISTIHSFLNSLISNYKKNIFNVIFDVFKLDNVRVYSLSDIKDDEKELNKINHNSYKKAYENYARKLFSLKSESVKKVVGKREYDKDPLYYNTDLNEKIDDLNLYIKDFLRNKDYRLIQYNETRFDSLKDLTYGHDSLLTISSLLFSRYPLISRILQDRFDYIFIDEFQDTHPSTIDIFLNKISNNNKTLIGLFGDSMQGIYDEGIGDVKNYVNNNSLYEITKRDNYRCSQQVCEFLNHNRASIDKLKQEVAFKDINGQSESINDRQGTVTVYYSVYPNVRPTNFSLIDEKNNYLHALMSLIDFIELENKGFRKLLLTNKAISERLEFSNLFRVFNERYLEVNDEIENCLEKLNLLKLAELCISYEIGNYNFVITEIKKAGFSIGRVDDKKRIKDIFSSLINDDLSAIDAINLAMDNGIIKRSQSFNLYMERKKEFLEDIELDDKFKIFKSYYVNDCKTFSKFDNFHHDFFDKNDEFSGRESFFNTLERKFKKENFYKDFFSKIISFKEIIRFYDYSNEKSDYITMHKTKGSGIDNVLVVMDDFFWHKYQFRTLFESSNTHLDMKLKMQKLFYVACSRAKNNLICARIITEDEHDSFIKFFPKNISLNRVFL